MTAAGSTTLDEAIQLMDVSPALFVENRGQWADASVRYAFFGSGANVLHTDAGPVIQLFKEETVAGPVANDDPMAPSRGLSRLSHNENGTVPFEEPQETVTRSIRLAVTFDGAAAVEPLGTDPAETVMNYFLGEESNWREAVASFETVTYPGLYEGIDLVTFGQRRSLKYEFHVAPGADHRQIEISYAGAGALWLDEEGQLHVPTEFGDLVDDAPYIYQMIDGEQVEVAGCFELVDADTYTFAITGTFDPEVELVVDPNVEWGTYLGGSAMDNSWGVATDSSDDVYVCGSTKSIDWGISDGWDASLGGSSDGFVVKFSSSTGDHLWSTYLGGSNAETAWDVATDTSGNVYVCGSTESSDWNISGGWDTSLGGASDGFVVRLSGSTGTHVWSTYLGGSSAESAWGVATNSSGDVYVCGQTYSSDWGFSGGWDTLHSVYDDGFLVKLSGSEGAHLWSTYLGGDNHDEASAVATDGENNVYVCGTTYSTSWAVAGGWDTSYAGSSDGFVVKLSDSTGAHLWSTYLGGASGEWARSVCTDIQNDVFVCGSSCSAGWGIAGGWDTTAGDPQGWSDDGFVIKLSGLTGAHLWSTYLGGTSSEIAWGIATDDGGNVFACGETNSTGWGIAGGWATSFAGSGDGFVVKLSGSTGAHLWSTYLGGSNTDRASYIATDGAGNLFICGLTYSPDAGMSGGWASTYGGIADGFLIKANDSPALPGDANRSGTVDAADAAILAAHWCMSGMSWADGDFNNDGLVDDLDLAILAANWGSQVGTSQAAGVVVPTGKQETPEADRRFIGPRQLAAGAPARRIALRRLDTEQETAATDATTPTRTERPANVVIGPIAWAYEFEHARRQGRPPRALWPRVVDAVLTHDAR
ncbi:MAG: SBBP repeat-containing protein [Pirellulales bacterium]|nr:SBBP repeat-containing protein [Pirellulales bacterium]